MGRSKALNWFTMVDRVVNSRGILGIELVYYDRIVGEYWGRLGIHGGELIWDSGGRIVDGGELIWGRLGIRVVI